MASRLGLLRLLAVPALALLGLSAITGCVPSYVLPVDASGGTCPPDTVCLAIPGFGALTGYSANKENVISSAIPDVLQVALFRYPGIQLVTAGELWRALRATHGSPADWKPANLFKPEVLRKAGANYVLRGRLYAQQGAVQLTGRITSLIEEDKWQSRTLQSDLFPERHLFDGVSSYAAAIIQALATGGKLDYRIRLFVAAPFCDASQPKGDRSAFYANDLPKALTERARSVDVVKMEFREDEGCVSQNDAGRYAQSTRADGVVIGEINLSESNDSITLQTQVFLSDIGVWKELLLKHDADTSYLEQKYILLDRFEQFLDAALRDDGEWETDFLETPRQLTDQLDAIDQLLEQGKLQAAEFLLLEVLSNDPRSAEALHRLGLVRFQQRRLELAIGRQREAIREQPEFPDAYRALGDALVALRDYEEAEKAYGELLRLEPNSVQTYLALGNVADFQRHTRKAIELFREVLRVDPENSSALSRLGDLYSDRASKFYILEKWRAAYRDFNLAIEIDPSPAAKWYARRALSFTILVGRGEIESEHGFQPAINDYRKALDIFNNRQDHSIPNIDFVFLNLQELYLLEDDYENSIQVAQEYFGLDASEVDRHSRREMVARFQIIIALILANQPHQEELELLQAQIDGAQTSSSYFWSFEVLDNYLNERQPPLSAEHARMIQEIKARVSPLL